MSGTLSFPSQAWFECMAEQMRGDEPRFRALGPVDCAMIVNVDLEGGRSTLHEVIFRGFGVHSVRELDRLEQAPDSHFVIAGPLEAWRDMLDNIHARNGADLEHTLNTLTLADDPLRVSGPDQLETDAFYRYNETLQRFFDGAARVETSYPVSPSRKVA